MRYGCDVNPLPHCCGFYEAGYFRVRDGYSSCEIQHNSWEKVLKSALEEAQDQPLIFNFVKPKYPDEYEEDVYGVKDEEGYCAGELRALVKAHPDAKHIGTFYNENSSNTVDSWYIYNQKNG